MPIPVDMSLQVTSMSKELQSPALRLHKWVKFGRQSPGANL